MKQVFYSSLLAISLLMISCAKDKTNDPTAPSNPSSDVRDSYTGNWNASEITTTSSSPIGYTVSITKSNSFSSSIIIENFTNLSTYTVSATVSNNTFTIPYQAIKDNLNSTIGFAKGSGTLTTSTKINLTYTTNIAGNRDSCTTTYNK